MDRKQGWLISGLLTLLTIGLAAGISENTRQLVSMRREMNEQNIRSTQLLVDVLDRLSAPKEPLSRNDSGSMERSQDAASHANEHWGPLELQLAYGTVDAEPVVNAEIHTSTEYSSELVSLGRTDQQGALRVPRMLYPLLHLYIDLPDNRLYYRMFLPQNGRLDLVLPKMKRVRPRLKWPAELRKEQFVIVFDWDLNVSVGLHPGLIGYSQEPDSRFGFHSDSTREPSRVHIAEFKKVEPDDRLGRSDHGETPPRRALIDFESDSGIRGEAHFPIHDRMDEYYTQLITATVYRYDETNLGDIVPNDWSELIAKEQLSIPKKSDQGHDFSKARMIVEVESMSFDGVIEPVEGEVSILWLEPNREFRKTLRTTISQPDGGAADPM